jgi:uncharacterized protein (DUF2252 family)
MSIVAERTQVSATQRQQEIVASFADNFSALMRADPDAWRGKFRKMAATPYAFYRGSAALFYADIAGADDPFLDDKTSRVWIHGDLHAENFGTYMNSAGVLVFDVNDFDEAYVAPFTWDLKRLAASLALIGYQKALSDAEIDQVIAAAAQSYARQVEQFAHDERTNSFALTLSNTQGKLHEVLQVARQATRVALLDSTTHIENYDRRFTHDKLATPVDSATRKKAEAAFKTYLSTIPASKRFATLSYNIKDICARRGMGIGSAGYPSFNFLVEGPTEALENDIIIYMKQAQTASPSRVSTDAAVKNYFLHDGHRTVVSQRALQAYADPWLGYTTYEGVGQLVAEVSPYSADLEWGNINVLSDILGMAHDLGRATAKIHCVADTDSDQTLVPFSTDAAIHAVLAGREQEFVKMITVFGETYAGVVRRDHGLFIDAFRNHQFPGL